MKIQEQQIIASMQGIAIDAINKAKQGHIGMAIDAAPITYNLIGKILNFSNKDAKWINRDRFIMSAGHGSMAYYSILHFMGLLPLTEIKKHKEMHSKTPSHPEMDQLKYVDASTGPLGQGLAMGVGMAISEFYLSQKFNKKRFKIFDHKTFVLIGDGCLQEGVALESIQLAGTLNLKNLIIIQDYNDVQIDSRTKEVNDIDFLNYFKSNRFATFDVTNPTSKNILNAINSAKKSTKPSFVRIHTKIAHNTPYEDTSKGHNGTLTEEETIAFKNKIGLENTKPFQYDKSVYDYGNKLLINKNNQYDKYMKMFKEYQKKYNDDFKMLNKLLKNQININLLDITFDEHDVATRNYFMPIINKLENDFSIIGGSADLFAATKIGFKKDIREGGKNIKYGIREHAMVAINNGIFLHSNIRTIDSTFLCFADFSKPAYRLGSLMNIPSIHVLTHDSYQVGGDGPTHQPFDQLAMLRSIHKSKVIRPCDESEVKYAFQYALNNKDMQIFIIGCRQPIKSFNKIKSNTISLPPAYFIHKVKDAHITLLASGSEVELAMKASQKLEKLNINAQVISVPLLQELVNSKTLISKLNINNKPLFAIEASNDNTWYKLAQFTNKFDALLASGYGYSAPGDKVYKAKGFNVNNIIKKVQKLLS